MDGENGQVTEPLLSRDDEDGQSSLDLAGVPGRLQRRLGNVRVQIEEQSFRTGSFRLRGEALLLPDTEGGDTNPLPTLDEYLKAPRENGSSVMGAVFNVVNLFMGVALLSIVYAIAQGGWLSFVPLVAAGAVMCLSACLLGACLGELPDDSPQSYPDVASLAWGTAGRIAAVVFCFMELFGNACMNLIVMWQEIEALLKHGSSGILGLSIHNSSVLIGVLALLPFFLMGNLKTLSYLSLVGIVCTVVITLSVLSLVAVDPHRGAFPPGDAPGYEVANPRILLSIGIFCIALSQHSALPAVRNSLADRGQFYRVMLLSFCVLVFLFGTVGAAGYYYFGVSAHEIITEDLKITWIGHVHIGHGFNVNSLLMLLVGLQGLSAIPTGIAVLQEMLLDILWCTPDHHHVHWLWASALRYLLFFVLSILAYTGYHVLGEVEGLIGGLCSMTCSLLLPVVLFTSLRWRRLPFAARAGLSVLSAVAVAVLLLVVAASLFSIVSQSGGGDDDNGSTLQAAHASGTGDGRCGLSVPHSELSTFNRLYACWKW